ncbi:TPA: hypothetical protein DCY67_05515 [Candidatus Acetothermia bacterium]|nr:hypothetical protein [Candidatus Acetothermia bacterium]
MTSKSCTKEAGMQARMSTGGSWRWVLGILLGLGGAFSTFGAALMPWPDHSLATISGTVIFVADGDTVVVDTGTPPSGAAYRVVNGLTVHRYERVRYLGGINTPEVWGPVAGRPEDLAYEARWANWRLVHGRQVMLEISPERPRDDFGRLLAYVHVERNGEWTLVNAELIRQGLGVLDPRFHQPGDPYYEYFGQMRIEALVARRGIWGRFPGVLTMAELIANPVKYMDEAITVRFTVTETRDGRRRRPGLYVHGESPPAFNFRVFIPEQSLSQFEQAGMQRDFWQAGMEIAVTGIVTWDRGLFIILESPLQVHHPPAQVGAPTGENVPAGVFACPNLERAVREALGRATGPLSADELAGITELVASHREIGPLSGIEALVNLQTLRVDQNQIRDISPLAGLRRLRELDLGRNLVADLSPLARLTGLRSLNLSVNQIRDISALAGLSSLEDLRLHRNWIVDISPLSGLAALRRLQLWGNAIVDLAPLRGAAELETLLLGENDIADIGPVAGLTKLRELELPENQIEDIAALRGMVELRRLDLTANRIADVSPLAELTRLQTLHLCRNPLASLTPLAALAELEELLLGWTKTDDIAALAGLTGLKSLSLGWNRITDLAPLAGLTGLTQLWIYWNEVTDIRPLAGLVELTELALRSNQISDIAPLAGLTELEWLCLAMNQVRDVGPLAELVHLSELSVSWNQITDIAPLVANPGLVAGDTVFIGNNLLDLAPGSVASIAILELQRRGVSVR